MFATKDRPPQDAAVPCRPIILEFPARISSKLRQDSQNLPPCVFSSLRTLLPAQILQATYFHLLPHSSSQERKVTSVFSARSAVFLRSSAKERKSTPLFSCTCALFCRYVGVRAPTSTYCYPTATQASRARSFEPKSPVAKVPGKGSFAVSKLGASGFGGKQVTPSGPGGAKTLAYPDRRRMPRLALVTAACSRPDGRSCCRSRANRRAARRASL